MEKTTFQPLPHVPLSKVVKANGFLFLAGEASIDWSTRATVPGDITVQTQKTLENLRTTLESVGSSLERVVKTTVFLTNIDRDFKAMNEVYRTYFPEPHPARSTFEVKLAVDVTIEVEAIAIVD